MKECIDNHMTGFDMGEVAGLTWTAMITESGLSGSHRKDQRLGMEPKQPWPSDPDNFFNDELLYSKTFYDV